ncbi:MAG: hypothetical protein M9936_17500 [Caldilinea sp.]|nr:hypothetical protein [Caldilinea sp.]MCB9117826.1 hypothetical protein [Caldilineaceae bacterium]MCO5211491.1 hypothetical protein [Caldilinea sp.]
MSQSEEAVYSFDRPGVYEIHVLGRLRPDTVEYLDGTDTARLFRIGEGGVDVTVLTSWLPDQAALIGILNTLYDLGYTLTLVRQVEYGLPHAAG